MNLKSTYSTWVPWVLTAVIRSGKLPFEEIINTIENQGKDFSPGFSIEYKGMQCLNEDESAGDFFILPRSHQIDEKTTTSPDDLTNIFYQVIRDFFSQRECDFCIQNYHPIIRRKKMLFADMDSTLIENETLDNIAQKAGVGKKVAEITRQGVEGKIDFRLSMEKRLSLLKGMPIEPLIDQVAKEIHYHPGAKTLVRTLKHHGVICHLVTGGFDPLASQVQKTLSIDHLTCNRFKIMDHLALGEWEGDLVTGEKKLQVMENSLRDRGMLLEQALAIGDGSNDIPMLQKAGLGVAYYAKDKVKATIPHHIQFTPLTTLLYYQGYSQREFVYE